MHVSTEVLDILYNALKVAESEDAITNEQMIKARNTLDELAAEEPA